MPSDGRNPLAVAQFCLNKKEKLPILVGDNADPSREG